MSKREEEITYEVIKTAVIVAILLTVALIIVGRWVCQAAVRLSLAVSRHFGSGDGATDRQAAWLSLFWFALFAMPALASGDVVVALAGIAFGFVVARLVWLELTGWRDIMKTAREPGSLILGMVRGGNWWSGFKPYVITAAERCQHLVFSGSTGTGKTSAGTHLIEQDLWNGASLVVADPKSDYADAILSIIPEHRIDDVVVFDPSDLQPVGINPFHGVQPEQWSLAAGELLSVFASYFGDSWSLRQAHLMKMAILVLLPLERATILDLPRLFQDRPFRQQAAFRCPNEAVRQFWLGGEYDESWANKDMSPILYKLGALTTFPEVRRIFGQPVPRISFSQIVNGGKIFILRAPTGVVGPEIADLLASLVVMRTQLECHRRAGSEGPRRFVGLWVDESSHVESGALTRLIAESRSFRLGAALLTQTTKYFSRELQIGLETNVGTQLRTFQQDGKYWLEVKRLNESEPITFPHPGPLPALDHEKIARIRARSRELYGATASSQLQLVAAGDQREPGAITATGESVPTSRPSKNTLTVVGGHDVDEE
ncbi:MAG: type IV secretion system DNA-binding domain-containing protein [Dehalococcoidia bacterium]|nr:type IV secretion system DNA-binding domain-containing protein [Dehalococcoidia bacterium]